MTLAGSFDSARASDTPHPAGPRTAHTLPEVSGRSKPESSAVHEHSTRPGAATGARPVSSISRSGGPSPTKAGHAPRPGPRGDYLRGRPTGARPAFVGLGPPERAASPGSRSSARLPGTGRPTPAATKHGQRPGAAQNPHPQCPRARPPGAEPAPRRTGPSCRRNRRPPRHRLTSCRLWYVCTENDQSTAKRCVWRGGCPRWGTPDRHGSGCF